MPEMKIGIWNIDHPETASGNHDKEGRFSGVIEYLNRADCDILVITEANSAIRLTGYFAEFSAPSPFVSSKRFYKQPNSYHQVAIYSRLPIKRIHVDEPINGLLCSVIDCNLLNTVYGNVITIKDQWSKTSDKSYTDRLNEQIQEIRSITQEHALIGGDFNLRWNWPQKAFAHRKVEEELESQKWIWPTKNRVDTVQHVLHSDDLCVKVDCDFLVKYDDKRKAGLSDHPFIRIQLSEDQL